MQCRRIALTFDYEVFLGNDSGSLHASLLEPVDRILELFEQQNSRGIFFVDASFLVHLNKFQTSAYDLIAEQLARILSSGSSVELHLHPHWLDANRIQDCRWDLSNSRFFRLHSLERQDRLAMFREAAGLLNQIVAPFSQKKVTAFRAGGWCIQPFSDLREAFIENDIELDFSVMPGKYRNNKPIHYYDYRRVPATSWWRFDNDVCNSDEGGQFVEVPLSMIKFSRLDMLKNRRDIRGLVWAGDGKGAALPSSTMQKVRKIIKNESMPLSIDYVSFNVVKPYLEKLDGFSVLVGHPKILSDDGFNMLKYCCTHFETLDTNGVRTFIQEQA